MHSNFAPNYFDEVMSFVESWPNEIPLAIELRLINWYNDKAIVEDLNQLLEANNISNVMFIQQEDVI